MSDEMAAAAVPCGITTVPDNDALQNLLKVDHIVVLTLENRSFDHMPGILSIDLGQTDLELATPCSPAAANVASRLRRRRSPSFAAPGRRTVPPVVQSCGVGPNASRGFGVDSITGSPLTVSIRRRRRQSPHDC